MSAHARVFHVVDISKQIMSNISTHMVAMAMLPLHVHSTLKYLAIALIRTVK